VVSRDGKVRLVERAELQSDWDPATDARLTVWETTQYLIRALDSSETEDSGAYNMLVTAWPELVRLAASSSTSAAEERLF
jgi:putative DNA methylase